MIEVSSFQIEKWSKAYARDKARFHCKNWERLYRELGYFKDTIDKQQGIVDQLLSTVTNIVQASSATDNRKTTETLCSLTTLDDLHRELTNLGFKLSHSAVYLRVLPRRGDSREGKRHIQMAPVKLLRSEHSLRPKNIDSMYVKREILLWWHDVNQWATWRRCCNLPVKRYKARIALGFAAASLQSPILMHLDYHVRLPDHDFVIGQKHKLISFVYGVCEVSTKGKVSIQVIHSSE